MRPQGRDQHASLYFSYPTFSAPITRPATDDTTYPVVIVGAGPIGLSAALTLARQGIKSVLLDDKATFNDGSRAICVSRSSFYAFERMGAVQAFEDKALGWTKGRGYFRGQEIGQFDMPHDTDDKHLPMYNLQQQYIEAFLHDAVVKTGMVDIRWQTALVDLDQQADHVALTLQSPDEKYQIKAQYYLAADGARSTTRHILGLRLAGQNLEGRYVIADIQMDHDYPTERRAFFEPASNPGGTILIHRQPDNIWRIDYQLAPDENADFALQEANIRARISAILAETGAHEPWELEWWSIYSANTLCLDDYRHGRIFFIGDSAHIVPIFGVRGLNNGVLDAENIGWKLARVLKGTADETLLDSYSVERRGATLDVFANASKSAAFMTPPSFGHNLMRRAALSLSLTQDFARKLSNPRQMTPYTYQDSPITNPDDSRFTTGATAGDVCLNAKLEGGYLLDDLGRGFTGLLFGGDDSLAKHLGVIGTKSDPDFKLILVKDPELYARFGAIENSFYLIRPDQHIAGRWYQVTPEILRNALPKLGASQ